MLFAVAALCMIASDHPHDAGGTDTSPRNRGEDTMSQQDTTAGTTPASMTMTPDSGPQAGGTPVTITNGSFSGVPQLFFAGVPATDVKVEAGGTTLTAVTPAGAAAGPAEGTVTTSTVPVKVGMFDYIAPAVTGVSPTEGPLAGGTPVTITGNGFAGATEVMFGGVLAKPFTVSADGNSITTVTLTRMTYLIGQSAKRLPAALRRLSMMPSAINHPAHPTVK